MASAAWAAMNESISCSFSVYATGSRYSCTAITPMVRPRSFRGTPSQTVAGVPEPHSMSSPSSSRTTASPPRP